jgi:hypothetical protein
LIVPLIQLLSSRHEKYYQGCHLQSIYENGNKPFARPHNVLGGPAREPHCEQSKQFHLELSDYILKDDLAFQNFQVAVREQHDSIHHRLIRIGAT